MTGATRPPTLAPERVEGAAVVPEEGAAPLRARLLVPVAAVTALVLVLSAVAVGLRVPLTRALGLPGLGGLDYRSLRAGELAPLRDAFVDAVLGTSFVDDRRPRLDPVGPDPTAPAPVPAAGAGAAAGSAAPARTAAGRGPIDHAFTNDDFERAQPVQALPYDARVVAARAGRQPREPATCSRTGGTVWYRYTPVQDARLEADTFGTARPTALGVFTGDSLDTLRQVGCSSDARGGALVGFAAEAGTPYFFQVTGVLEAEALVFHLTELGTTQAVSTDPASAQQYHRFAAVSGDGNVVAYSSTVTPACPTTDTCEPDEGQVVVVDRRTGAREVVSVTPTGGLGQGLSHQPTLSHDGRFVGFVSTAPDLVEGDTNRSGDYFVRDRRTRSTVRASVTSDGGQGVTPFEGRGYFVLGSLSASGRYAVFSTGSRLSEDDLNIVPDVYVHDLRTRVTTIESVTDDGGRATRGSDYPTISADGRWVAFTTYAEELDGRRERCDQGYGETRSCFSALLRDRTRGTSQVVSRRLDGQPDLQVVRSSLSSDGGTVVWTSTEDRLVPGDTNGVIDVFAWDRRTGRTTRVSVTSAGEQQLDPTPIVAQGDRSLLAVGIRTAAVSGDGRFVVFESRADNLVAQDDNGATDVFRHDRLSGSTRRVSVTAVGGEGNGDSVRPSVSADGSVVAFESDAPELESRRSTGGPRDPDAATDVYVHAPTLARQRGRVP